MEGMRRTRGIDRGREGQLDSRIGGKDVDIAGREKIRGRLCSAHDLQQHGKTRRCESGSVHEEVRAVLMSASTYRLSRYVS